MGKRPSLRLSPSSCNFLKNALYVIYRLRGPHENNCALGHRHRISMDRCVTSVKKSSHGHGRHDAIFLASVARVIIAHLVMFTSLRAYRWAFELFEILWSNFPPPGKMLFKRPTYNGKLMVKCPNPRIILTVILSVQLYRSNCVKTYTLSLNSEDNFNILINEHCIKKINTSCFIKFPKSILNSEAF